MDYFAEGKKAQITFKKLDSYSSFEKKIIAGLLKGKTANEASDFLKGLLDKTSNQVLFIYGIDIATEFKDSTLIWSTICKSFNKMVKGSKTPPWVEEFVMTLFRNDDVNLAKNDAHLLIDMMLSYKNDNDTYLLSIMSDAIWFDNLRPELMSSIIDNIGDIKPPDIFQALKVFPKYGFYQDIIKNTDNEWMIIKVLSRYLIDGHKTVDGYNGAVELFEILKTCSEKIINNWDALSILSDLVAQFHDEQIIIFFIDMIDRSQVNENGKIKFMMILKDLPYKIIHTKLFELTGDVEFIPVEAKDIFLF